ncbi:MAG: pyridoxamine 5'-phosphate oxidase family protein [Deltaproteobacteria bacterium]|nr:pyridoxamine 5'-phosphate oxidase family protein [Deltaproteobacteria bacterium]
MIKTMKKLLKEKDICVLATAFGGTPHCSLMAYVTDDECREIYMVTSRNSRKYKNLSGNPSVSLLVDTREEHTGSNRPEAKAMTITGTYQRVEDPQKELRIREKLLIRHPHLKQFFDAPAGEIIRIRIASFLLLNGLTEAHFEEL